MVNQTIVQRRAQIEIGEGDVLIIREGEMERKAKIVDFDENRLVLEPITKSGNSGKLIFERVVEKPKK
jgi:virulence-associated protein VagC